jgi:hypothetical protein
MDRSEGIMEACKELAKLYKEAVLMDAYIAYKLRQIFTDGLAKVITVGVTVWVSMDEEEEKCAEAIGQMRVDLKLAEILLGLNADAIAEAFHHELGISREEVPTLDDWKRVLTNRFQMVADVTSSKSEIARVCLSTFAKCGRSLLDEDTPVGDLERCLAEVEVAEMALQYVYYPSVCGHTMDENRIWDSAEKRLRELYEVVQK